MGGQKKMDSGNPWVSCFYLGILCPGLLSVLGPVMRKRPPAKEQTLAVHSVTLLQPLLKGCEKLVKVFRASLLGDIRTLGGLEG